MIVVSALCACGVSEPIEIARHSKHERNKIDLDLPSGVLTFATCGKH